MAKAAVPPLDFFLQASVAPEDISHPLVLGRSSSDLVISTMKLKRRTMFAREDFAPGWQLIQADMVSLLFDPSGIWQGIWYGHDHQALTWQVEGAATVERGQMAVAGQDGVTYRPFDYPQITAGEIPIHFNGGDILRFATLPSFIAIANSKPSPTEENGWAVAPDRQWRMSGWDYDKSLSVETDFPYAILGASFLLKANIVPFDGRFAVDYCLRQLSLYTHAAATRSGD